MIHFIDELKLINFYILPILGSWKLLFNYFKQMFLTDIYNDIDRH